MSEPTPESLIASTRSGFDSLDAPDETKERALEQLRRWLTDPTLADYVPQIRWLIQTEQWPGLLDRFYQILPFGTGGRRGSVGIGPNRMNPWTLEASVQGHCDYLHQRFSGEADLRVALAFDVRQFEDQNKQYNADLANPVLHLSSRDLAQLAARVYAANGIHAHLPSPDSKRFFATPELSFAIRRLEAHGGLNVSASHNPPDDNGGKFYDEKGAQPVPPDDQIMADLVDRVTNIKSVSWQEAQRAGLIHIIDEDLHDDYIDLCLRQSLADAPKTDDFKVVFTPLHGVGSMTSMEVLEKRGFRVLPVASQMTPDGQFPNVTKTPNPENPDSMDKAVELAVGRNADLVLSTDPDADRIGMMAPDSAGNWRFVTGNEICSLLTHFKLAGLAKRGSFTNSPIVVTTIVTSRQVTRIARSFNAQVVEYLLVGFKYPAALLRRLEEEGEFDDITGTPEDFVLATEESHGALLTPAIRDKDAGAAALLLAELALEEKRQGRTVIDYLDRLSEEFGYFAHVNVPVYLRGLEGKQQMAKMLDSIRATPLSKIGGLDVTEVEDLRDESGRFGPLLGGTDAAARNVLIFRCGPNVQVALRPSGTEPKAKIYIEVCSDPRRSGVTDEDWAKTRSEVDVTIARLADDFVQQALAVIGLDPSAAG